MLAGNLEKKEQHYLEKTPRDQLAEVCKVFNAYREAQCFGWFEKRCSLWAMGKVNVFIESLHAIALIKIVREIGPKTDIYRSLQDIFDYLIAIREEVNSSMAANACEQMIALIVLSAYQADPPSEALILHIEAAFRLDHSLMINQAMVFYVLTHRANVLAARRCFACLTSADGGDLPAQISDLLMRVSGSHNIFSILSSARNIFQQMRRELTTAGALEPSLCDDDAETIKARHQQRLARYDRHRCTLVETSVAIDAERILQMKALLLANQRVLLSQLGNLRFPNIKRKDEVAVRRTTLR